jgi:hypothetical protein
VNNENHFTPEVAEAWRDRQLQPEDRLRWLRHLADCALCRDMVIGSPDFERLQAGFERKTFRTEHLDYEELEALTDGRASSGEREDFLSHIGRCPGCAAELTDLKALRAGLKNGARRRWLFILAPAAIALGLVVVVQQIRTTSHQPALLATSVSDSGRVIGLNDKGAVVGFEMASEEQRSLLRVTLGKLRLPHPENETLARKREVLLGGSGQTESVIRPMSPAGVVVADRTPRFTWEAPPSSGKFIISIYSTDFEEVAGSTEIAEHQWTPSAPLVAGRTYLWTVSGIVEGRRVTAPRAPEPEARFRIATPEEVQTLRAAEELAPHSDLLIAAVAAHLGMKDVAKASVRQLEISNPGSPLVTALSASLK